MPHRIPMNINIGRSTPYSNSYHKPNIQPSSFFKSSMLGRIDANKSRCGACSGVK